MMLGYYPPLQKQRLFYERQTNNIDQMFVVEAHQKPMAFTICKSLEEGSRDNEVTIWALSDLQTTASESSSVSTFKPPLKMIHSLSLSVNSEWLCVAGKDF